MKENKPDGKTKIHNVRFYNLAPRSINCLAYNKRNGKIALSRNDSSIEIWDITYAPFLEKTIFDCTNSIIEDLGWANNRLFSAGLSGQIIEWDLTNLTRKHSQYVTGNSIWCMDISRDENFLAVGTEEGYINIFNIAGGNFTYSNLFDKQDGRIVCCKFDKTGEFLVTGSLDVIRIWNTKTGHAIRKMTPGRSEAKKQTIVWSLQVLEDLTIISGDSRGQINIWDGKIGVQIESHQALQADVLAVAINDDENMLICSGVEPIIRMFALTTITKTESITKKWVKFLQRRVHDHDIKALVCVDHKVVSGGVDGYLGISSYSKMHQKITKHGPFLQSPCATVSSEFRLILLRYCTYLEIWRLGKAQGNSKQLLVASTSENENNMKSDNKKLLTLEEDPEKILEFRSKNDEAIICSTLSPNGLWLLYSTVNSIRLFSFLPEQRGQTSKINRIKILPEQFSPCSRAIFSFDSKSLFLIKTNTQIDIFNILTTNDIDYVETIDATKYVKDFIHLIDVSKCGKYFVVAGTCRNIAVWIKVKKQWKYHLNLPKYLVPTTAIALHSNIPRLVATFTDGKIFEYDLEEMQFTCSTNIRESSSSSYCINRILLDSRNENVIILHNDANLFVLEKVYNKFDNSHEEENLDGGSSRKKIKSKKLEIEKEIPKLKLKFRTSYEHFVHLDWLSEDEIVAVNVNPISLIEELPAPMRQKKFGAS